MEKRKKKKKKKSTQYPNHFFKSTPPGMMVIMGCHWMHFWLCLEEVELYRTKVCTIPMICAEAGWWSVYKFSDIRTRTRRPELCQQLAEMAEMHYGKMWDAENTAPMIPMEYYTVRPRKASPMKILSSPAILFWRIVCLRSKCHIF